MLTSNRAAKPSLEPFGVVRAAMRAVPAVKYALGVAGVMAALAIGRTFFSSSRAAIFGALCMLGLMVLLLVFSASTKLAPRFLQLPALVLTWAILVIFVLSGSLFAASVFFEWPKPFPILVHAILGTQEAEASSKPARSASISGIVFGPSGNPLSDVTVTASSDRGNQLVTHTDSAGSFYVELPGSLAVSLKFEKRGYAPKLFQNLTVGSNPRVSLEKEVR